MELLVRDAFLVRDVRGAEVLVEEVGAIASAIVRFADA